METEEDFIADLFQVNSQSSSHEVEQYLACSDTTAEPLLKYWHRKAGIWPKLATVAVSVLSVPATSTPSEGRSRWLAAHWRNVAHSCVKPLWTACCFYMAYSIKLD